MYVIIYNFNKFYRHLSKLDDECYMLKDLQSEKSRLIYSVVDHQHFCGLILLHTYIHPRLFLTEVDFVHHHQPINVTTAGAQAFVIDYT
jgi:hypothetical protein